MENHPPSLPVDVDACGTGFVARIGNGASREVVERALTALLRLSHRGGVDADGLSGDGAGLLTPIPRGFFQRCAATAGIRLPQRFGLGMVFLPPADADAARAAIQAAVRQAGLRFLGWRAVPTDGSVLGPRAAATLPAIAQCFVSPGRGAADFERSLFLLRKRIESEAPAGTYFCSLSSRTVVYKGLLVPWQLAEFYRDLADPEFAAPFAIFHQRYATNTRPSWSLAQPFRAVAHNGEINTIVSNRRWMRARAPELGREFGASERFRALEEGVSDSASLDNAVEIALRQGYSLPAALLRLVPPARPPQRNGAEPDARLRRFLESSAAEQEPWDGPAALVCTDGRLVGAKLDRNGLRPMRYTLTTDGLVIAGSETGLACLEEKQIAERGRLGPGEMLVVDPAAGKIYRDAPGNGISALLRGPKRSRAPGRRAVVVAPQHGNPQAAHHGLAVHDAKRLAAAYGWTEDQHRLLFLPLGSEGREAVWSMGDDAPPAFLSRARRPLWDYCKQRFAQVTNPPIDPLREAHVMSLEVRLNGRAVLPSPVADEGQMARLRGEFFRPVHQVDITFDARGGVEAAQRALARIPRQAARAASRGDAVLLSDRRLGPHRAALPALLATAAAWKAMAGRGTWRTPLVIESGQVIETHHVALLIAAGASAVHPFLALELAEQAAPGGAQRFRKAVETGLRKVLARMGISCLASYRNSQLFEIVGLDESAAAEFFPDASCVLGVKPLEELLGDVLARHAEAFSGGEAPLRDAGLYRFRNGGEQHASSPELVRRLHRYIAAPTGENYRAFSELSAEREPVAVRDLLDFRNGEPVPLAEVESEQAILARFSTQAMSLGALGPEAHRTIAIAMNRLGARSNTGEGGEDPDVYSREPEANNRVKQVASARFGVTTEYLVNADELEIKMAQGSKPGEGGQLPASKVTPYIARLRHAVPGMALISPPPHHDIYSIEDLAQLIYDLRAVNPRARIGVKLVAGSGVGLIAAGVAKAGAEVITIAGFDGGTGASPLTSIKNTGLPWEAGLADAHRTLERAGLRGRVRLRVDGGLKSGRDVLLAAAFGADEFGFGTTALVAIGCVMARQCHLNTCPAGIATQDEAMRLRFAGNPEMVMQYFRGVAGEVRELLARLGARSLAEICGATQLLRAHPRAGAFPRAAASLLAPSEEFPPSRFVGARVAQKESGVHIQLRRLLAEPADPPRAFAIMNSDRATGAHLSGEIQRRRAAGEPAPHAIECEFHGSAGQSFGAFLVPGLHFRLNGDANDYVGKGLSGGTISISAGAEASLRDDVLAGNTVLYGATAGALFLAGRAGERFAVRNSGALAVAEGLGDHGCEYMTAGVVVILGPVGRNFGSGMTGGLAYVAREFLRECDLQQEFVRPAAVDGEEQMWLRRVLREHLRTTGSPRARALVRLRGPLPLVRVEPVRLPCPIAQTWTMAAASYLHPEPAIAAAVLRRKAQPQAPLEAVC